MGEYSIGQFIYRSRKALGLTQEELCEGEDGYMCCSVETLSRVERGKQRPNYRTIRELMQHLGKETCFCGSYLKTEEYQVLELDREFRRMLVINDYGRAEELLEELESHLSQRFATNRQYLLYNHALLDRLLGRITAEEALELMEKALSLTLPSYGTELFRFEVLIPQEIVMVCNIADNYGNMGNVDKALELLEILKFILEDFTVIKRYPDALSAMVKRNRIKWIGEQKKYEEAVAGCSKEINHWVKNGTATTLPGLYYARAYNLQSIMDERDSWLNCSQEKINFELEMCAQLSDLFGNELRKKMALEKMRYI